MRIDNIIKEYARKSEIKSPAASEFAEDYSNKQREQTLETANFVKQMSVKDIYSMMNQTKLLEEKLQKEAKEKDSQEEAKEEGKIEEIENLNIEEGLQTETDSDIIVKPDGSRVLVITTTIGGMKTSMSLEISKPTDMINDNKEEIEEETREMDMENLKLTDSNK